MNLYLSSYRIGEHETALKSMASPGVFALVPNALDSLGDPGVKESVIGRSVTDLERLGFLVTVFDLRTYFGRVEALGEALRDYRNVFVTGGNVFVLRRAMAQSGFDEFVRSRIGDRSFLYTGYSAGSCVCSPTLYGLDCVDDPNIVPGGYETPSLYRGLSLIPFTFVPHFDSNHPESPQIEEVIDYCTRHRIPYRAYRDGEVFIDRDNHQSRL